MKNIKTKPKELRRPLFVRYLLVAAGVLIIVPLAIFGYKTVASYRETAAQKAVSDQRKARIEAIYAGLKLGPNYTLTGQSVFGEKKVYEWDKSRTYSSSETFSRPVNVDTAVADLRAKIEHAGFKYFEEPYPGSSFTELHFKSAKNEYLRLNVSGQPYMEAVRQKYQAKDNSAVLIDPNLGPAVVVIKVNLDDNNE